MRKRLRSTVSLVVTVAGLLYLPLAVPLAVPLAARAQSTPTIVDVVRAGDLETARALLAAGSDVDAPQGDGATALHWAAHRNDLDAAALLIEAGADVNAANALGATAL